MINFAKSALVFLEREINVYAYSVVSALSLNAGGAVTWSVAKSALYAGIPSAVSLAHTLLGQLAGVTNAPAAQDSVD